ncbi:MAG: AraC family transcriptional regulator [Lachnospiraceae bacterium]|jgi:AraC-like DNA-binding protein|nr:AraC family transcriptional regulator [Lachnospiraceae bacterium]
MSEIYSDISYQELHPTIWYCSRVRDSRFAHYHSHKNIEIAFVLAGRGQYFVDGKTYDVKQGDLLICNPGVMHQSIVTNPEDPTLEFVCGFSDIHLHDMPENRIVLPDDCPILSLSSETKRELSRCCYEIIEENSSSEPGRYYMIQAQMMRMLVIIFRALNGHKPSEAPGLNFESYSKGYVVKNILNYLNENYSQHISLDQIARNMYLSPVYISKIFKEKTGDSPINYLIRVRLSKAREMLTEGRGSIRSISAMVGYDDVYHFSKLFKKHYGVSPMYYRKKVAEEDEED